MRQLHHFPPARIVKFYGDIEMIVPCSWDIRCSPIVFGTIAALAVAMAGCMSDIDYRIHEVLPVRADLIAERKIKAETISGPSLILSPPSVRQLNQELLISGTVYRRPGINGDIPGFLAVQVMKPSGSLTDQLTIHWVPDVIPSSGDRSATYSARLLGIPQEGSTVRVAYFDSAASLKSSVLEEGRPLEAVSPKPPEARLPGRPGAGRPEIQLVQLSNIQIRLVSASITKVKSESADGKQVFEPVRPQLAIVLEIKNLGDSHKCEYRTWGIATPVGDSPAPVDDGIATLSDDNGHKYRMESYGFGDSPIGRVESAQIDPGKKITDMLVFADVPREDATSMVLDLPARNVGETGVLRLQFSASAIQR